MISLEKCPCCGGDAVYSYYTKTENNEKYSAYVTCSVCGLRTKAIERDVSYSAEDKVAELWNARA